MALLSIEAQLKYALLTRPIRTDRTTNNTFMFMCGKKTFEATELESERVNEQLFIRYCLKTQQKKEKHNNKTKIYGRKLNVLLAFKVFS